MDETVGEKIQNDKQKSTPKPPKLILSIFGTILDNKKKLKK